MPVALSILFSGTSRGKRKIMGEWRNCFAISCSLLVRKKCLLKRNHFSPHSGEWRNGIRDGLKIHWWQHHESSTLSSPTEFIRALPLFPARFFYRICFSKMSTRLQNQPPQQETLTIYLLANGLRPRFLIFL